MSKMEKFAKIVNGFYPLTIFFKNSILHGWQGLKASVIWNSIYTPNKCIIVHKSVDH